MKKRTFLWVFAILVLLILAYGYLSQAALDHGDASFVPDYGRTALTPDSSDEVVFFQTGLSPAAAEELDKEALEAYQEAFFSERSVVCENIFGFFVQQDALAEGLAPVPVAQTGDILISLSPHSAGWRHGHAALVLTQNYILQLTQYGKASAIYRMEDFLDLSSYALLRLKDRPEEFIQEIFDYTLDNMLDIPYRLLGPKADEENLALMCTSLVWYPYYKLGYDIDGDGGWFVSGRDILESPLLEVVQVYGMDPKDYVNRMAR